MRVDVEQVSVRAAVAARAFVMLNAEIRDPDGDVEGYYDPGSQTWIGGRRLGLGSYSSRSNGSKGGYSSQSDD
ncbi:MAG: hypothetical protein EXR07_20620 [Acetobacteraceae bacterium]|nr:hypothetical protein [Acetobacteraceae bacterium]